ncbi:hypothetical protein SCP_1403840 [Sparassis crispa]|uniref:Uncharacterized protein n=1 Tax=Sparassis crispa TaxID=139825 RepID=A0A401H3F9_9APHY|nr:hypothetical protein SCP_1403840 [Sparassis crispa]GBE88976.1 hypothetical protein SCP_1403840 [Sparassis crispa]
MKGFFIGPSSDQAFEVLCSYMDSDDFIRADVLTDEGQSPWETAFHREVRRLERDAPRSCYLTLLGMGNNGTLAQSGGVGTSMGGRTSRSRVVPE